MKWILKEFTLFIRKKKLILKILSRVASNILFIAAIYHRSPYFLVRQLFNLFSTNFLVPIGFEGDYFIW